MTVYVLLFGEDLDIVGVFTSLEAAKAAHPIKHPIDSPAVVWERIEDGEVESWWTVGMRYGLNGYIEAQTVRD